MSIVVDASVALSWLLPGKDTVLSLPLRDRAVDRPEVELMVPPGFWYEVANTLWVAGKRERISRHLAMEALETLLDFQFTVWAVEPAASLSIAFQQNLAVYDSAYLSLAQEFNATLWTLDKALTEAARSLHIPVEPV